tara:strand:- start:238 stop:543 length:306 start_codon:yes stop_codon:yes gene_type:complete
MFEKYKDGDLITLKLMHGEEVISTLQSQDETTINVKQALTLMQGPQGLAFGTFFSTADQEKDISIAKDKIQCVSVVTQKIQDEYKKVFSKIEVPSKPNIIV